MARLFERGGVHINNIIMLASGHTCTCDTHMYDLANAFIGLIRAQILVRL